MIVGIPADSLEGEKRVALVPMAVASLTKAGFEVVIEGGAGFEAGYPDAQYTEKGARIVSRDEAFGADVLLMINAPGANTSQDELAMMREGQVVIGFSDPLGSPEAARNAAEKKITLFSMEMIPRITRAQSMDALSSMASLSGYKCVLLAANALKKIFPMMMTAAGTLRPAKVFIVGAGVAGLQAIATAKRLGATVSAIDVRPAVKEQVESLGAKFVMLEEAMAEGEGGYAKEQTEEQKQKQIELMKKVVAESDIVITTALIPGKKAPVLVTEDMVKMMAAGSVIVDMAAERGGNCAVTKPGETYTTEHGVTILGPINIPATLPHDASQMYAKNITTFLLHMTKDGKLNIDTSDQVVSDTMVCRDGEVTNARIRQLLNLPALAAPEPEAASSSESSSSN